MKFAEKLKQIRTERDMSLSEFADLLGTSKQVLSRYERGDNTPKITTVQKYADILNVSLSYLTDDGIEQKETPAISPVMKEITGILSDMSPEQLAQVASYIRFIKSGG